MSSRPADLIFDWNEVGRGDRPWPGRVALLDETLRDGLQSPSATDPPIEAKIEILRLMSEIGVHHVNVGFPGSSARALEEAVAMCAAIAREGLRVRPVCAGRTVAADVAAIAEVSQRAGIAVEASLFIGSSPIRQRVESWDIDLVIRRSAEALAEAARASLEVCFVAEDATRAHPDVLRAMFGAALDGGARRLCLADTVGYAAPEGVKALVSFTAGILRERGIEGGIDWHGHNDRGVALGNALLALEAGADRVHATALGVGERTGNVAMELLVLNLELMGRLAGQDFTKLVEYCHAVSRALGWTIPVNYPLVGHDAFRTATGVHAAAIAKAEAKGDAWLVDRVYSAVPAGAFGRKQEIDIGHMSGASNVAYWLEKRGIEPRAGLIEAILAEAKRSRRNLREEEILALVRRPAE